MNGLENYVFRGKFIGGRSIEFSSTGSVSFFTLFKATFVFQGDPGFSVFAGKEVFTVIDHKQFQIFISTQFYQ